MNKRIQKKHRYAERIKTLEHRKRHNPTRRQLTVAWRRVDKCDHRLTGGVVDRESGETDYMCKDCEYPYDIRYWMFILPSGVTRKVSRYLDKMLKKPITEL